MAGSSSASQYSVNFAPQNQDLKFILDASSGAHSGTIEGVAQVKKPNQAVWEEMHQDATPPYTSKLTFTKKGDTLTVSAQNTETYGGAGISFDEGTYQRGLAQVDPHPLVTRGLLTPSEDDRVRALTGADYPLVVTCLRLVRQDEIKEKNFQGKVIDGFVRGLAPEMNARMTIENDGAITVGVTDCEQKQIRIYTTRPDRKIPAPFDLWDTSRYPVLLVPPTK